MDGRIIDRDDEVERRKLGREIIEIHERVTIGAVVEGDAEAITNQGRVGGTWAVLQVDKSNAGDLCDWFPELERDRALPLRLAVFSSTPGNSHLQRAAESGKPRSPLRDQIRIWLEIGCRRGKFLKPAAKMPWKATHELKDVATLGRAIGRFRDRGHIRQRPRKKRNQSRVALDEAARRFARQLRQARPEHHLIANSLFRENQD